MSAEGRRPRAGQRTDLQQLLGDEDASLLDIVDNVLNKGVVITGDITIARTVHLIYARLSLLLCAADRVLPSEDPDPMLRRRARRARRAPANRGA